MDHDGGGGDGGVLDVQESLALGDVAVGVDHCGGYVRWWWW